LITKIAILYVKREFGKRPAHIPGILGKYISQSEQEGKRLPVDTGRQQEGPRRMIFLHLGSARKAKNPLKNIDTNILSS
jgi:hypothetical protein